MRASPTAGRMSTRARIASTTRTGRSCASAGNRSWRFRLKRCASGLDRDRLDLDQPIRLSELFHDHSGARRQLLAEHLAPRLHHLAERALISQEGGDLHDVLKARAGLLEHRSNVAECLMRLRLDVARADQLAIGS